MIKDFKVKLPDEPYGHTFKKNKEVTCRYDGPRFIEIEVDLNTGEVDQAVQYADKQDEIRTDITPREGYKHILLDASKNTFEAAYATSFYTSSDIEEYKEVLPTGEEYIEVYSTDGVLEELFNGSNLKYVDGSFTGIEYANPPVTDEQMKEVVRLQLENVKQEKAEQQEIGAPADIVEKYTKLIEWLENYTTTYKDVPAHKVPFPNLDSF